MSATTWIVIGVAAWLIALVLLVVLGRAAALGDRQLAAQRRHHDEVDETREAA